MYFQLFRIQWLLCFRLVTSRNIYYLANVIDGSATVRHPYSWWYFGEDGKQRKKPENKFLEMNAGNAASVHNIHVRCVAVSAAKNQSIYYSSTHIGRSRSQKNILSDFLLRFLRLVDVILHKLTNKLARSRRGISAPFQRHVWPTWRHTRTHTSELVLYLLYCTTFFALSISV